MPLAIQTVVGYSSNPGATFTVVSTTNSGDSLNPANFNDTSPGFLDNIIRAGATKGAVRVRSPRLHDSTDGITFYTDIAVNRLLMPPNTGQPVYPADDFTVELTGGTAEYDLVGMTFYYVDLPGAAASLVQWADISGRIKNIKAATVAVTNSATEGTWTETVITTTENQYHANASYAVLGYATDAAMGVIAFKAPETGNYRIGGPGTDYSEDTVNYFVDMANRHGRPYIPVFNANNRAGAFVCTNDYTASSTANVTLVLAELA